MLATKIRAGFLAALVVNLVRVSTLNAGEAPACSCAEGFSAQEELRGSDAVFWGEVVSVEKHGLTASTPPLLGPVTFGVRGSWKGMSQEQVIVHGQGSGASCGLDFDRGAINNPEPPGLGPV